MKYSREVTSFNYGGVVLWQLVQKAVWRVPVSRGIGYAEPCILQFLRPGALRAGILCRRNFCYSVCVRLEEIVVTLAQVRIVLGSDGVYIKLLRGGICALSMVSLWRVIPLVWPRAYDMPETVM
jgi:hypothetical protein